MEYEILRNLLTDEKFQDMTVKDFVEAIKRSGTDLIPDTEIPEFLKDDFQPANVKHYTNDDKGADIVDEEEVEDEEYNKASSNLGTLI